MADADYTCSLGDVYGSMMDFVSYGDQDMQMIYMGAFFLDFQRFSRVSDSLVPTQHRGPENHRLLSEAVRTDQSASETLAFLPSCQSLTVLGVAFKD
ncbi:hypothetical protein J4Q44_G00299790 [Coregonus suidteri]|uniref:Uncharacterized protein n=1 Tax=Coregonus suidteri TaxID=861788 RepID=A0AAN8QII5_9TELE